MKPFTLEWWLNLRDMATHLANRMAQLDREEQQHYLRYHEYLRYKNLREWIKKRIINKYGEQESNA